MLLTAGDAPGCEDVDERNLAVKIAARQAELAPLNRRQAERRDGLADKGRGYPVGVKAESRGEQRGGGGEHDHRRRIEQPPRHAAAGPCRGSNPAGFTHSITSVRTTTGLLSISDCVLSSAVGLRPWQRPDRPPDRRIAGFVRATSRTPLFLT